MIWIGEKLKRGSLGFKYRWKLNYRLRWTLILGKQPVEVTNSTFTQDMQLSFQPMWRFPLTPVHTMRQWCKLMRYIPWYTLLFHNPLTPGGLSVQEEPIKVLNYCKVLEYLNGARFQVRREASPEIFLLLLHAIFRLFLRKWIFS